MITVPSRFSSGMFSLVTGVKFEIYKLYQAIWSLLEYANLSRMGNSKLAQESLESEGNKTRFKAYERSSDF
jgi:hypothetical protein